MPQVEGGSRREPILKGSVPMEPNGFQPEPTMVNPGKTRTQYQSPTITHLGGLEQVTLSVFVAGTGDDFVSPQGDLSALLASP